MIFKPELAKKVRMGAKTMTRRPIKDTDWDNTLSRYTCRYKPGRAYAIQPGRGKPSIGRLTVLEVHRETVGQITFKDAKREGFATTDEFKEYWAAMYGGTFNPDTEVWVISFRLGDWTEKSQHRLLAATPSAPGGDYTTEPGLALKGEPEAVTETEQAQITELGTLQWHQNRALRLAALEQQDLRSRLQQLEAAQWAGVVDVSSQLRVIRTRLRKLANAA